MYRMFRDFFDALAQFSLTKGDSEQDCYHWKVNVQVTKP